MQGTSEKGEGLILVVLVPTLIVLTSIVDALFENAPDEGLRCIPVAALCDISDVTFLMRQTYQ
jgi:hypothetical protein